MDVVVGSGIGNDTVTLLTPVLESIETDIGKLGSLITSVHTIDPTVVLYSRTKGMIFFCHSSSR